MIINEIDINATRNEIRYAIRMLKELLEHDDLPNEIIFHDGECMNGIRINKID